MSHFASPVILLAWLLTLIGLITLSWPAAGFALIAVSLFAGGIARPAFGRLVWRSRWLIFVMTLLMGWTTPGTPVNEIPGATREGLWMLAEHLSRLLICLAMVALLFTLVKTTDLLAGAYVMLQPLQLVGISPAAIVLRLALVVRRLEGGAHSAQPLPETIRLSSKALGINDGLLLGGMLVLLLVRWI